MKQKSKKQTKSKEAVSSKIDMLCPRCGAMMRAEGGCRICPLCGYTPCG